MHPFLKQSLSKEMLKNVNCSVLHGFEMLKNVNCSVLHFKEMLKCIGMYRAMPKQQEKPTCLDC